MDKALGVLIANQRVPRPAPVPRLRLLVEWESRRRVFFDNLGDLLLSRRVPPIPLTSRPARFWDDVFVPSGAAWSAFVESMLWHLLLIVLFVWGQSRVWTSVQLFPKQHVVHRPITYYPPPPSFPAAGARAASVRARVGVKHVPPPANQTAMPVRAEQKPSIVTPPDIKQATARPPNLPGSDAAKPMVPFSATSNLRRNALAGPSGAVAPPPQVDQTASRRLALPRGSPIAPAPDVGDSFAERTGNVPNSSGTRVVPPPPTVQNAGNSARGERLSSLPGSGSQVVPPAPSVQGAGNSAAAGRSSSLSATGPNVVPPPPVVGTGKAARDTRAGSIAGTGSQVVPPPPSVQGAGNSATAGRSSSLSASRSEVVPPAPTVEGTSKSGASGRVSSLAGEGSQIVPPPPTVESAGKAGAGGRLGSLNGDDSQIAPPPAVTSNAGNSGAGGPGKLLEPMDPLTADASSSAPDANNAQKSTFEELPLGLLGIVFVPPGTSYFSNFEVFVAKRRMGKEQLQLIKLVYEFLPYQRRLSEYNLNNLPARVIKLKVTPDPSCDESLGHMIQPYTDATRSATAYPDIPEALRSSDLNATLPCYRTTAGDFEKAMSRGH